MFQIFSVTYNIPIGREKTAKATAATEDKGEGKEEEGGKKEDAGKKEGKKDNK